MENKAQQLVDSFKEHAVFWDCYNDEPLEENHAKQCALIAVEEIIKAINENMQGFLDSDIIFYWENVKEEIKLL